MTERTSPELNAKRAEFVYEGARLQAKAVDAPIVPEPWYRRTMIDPTFCEQFCKVIERQCGPDRSADPEALHDDWVRAYVTMGWTYGYVRDLAAKTHPDMVPFDQLEQREQDKDAVFIALCEIARLWIRHTCRPDATSCGSHRPMVECQCEDVEKEGCCQECPLLQNERPHTDHAQEMCWCGGGPKAYSWKDDAMTHRPRGTLL